MKRLNKWKIYAAFALAQMFVVANPIITFACGSGLGEGGC